MHSGTAILNDTSPFALRRNEIMVTPGLFLHVVEFEQQHQRAEAPAVLFLHGLGDSASVWRDVAAALCTRARVLAVDLRGHGDSTWPEGADYQVSTMAADVEKLMQALVLPKLTLVGHSMGAAVALRIAFAYSHHVQRLVLADFGLDAEPQNAAQLGVVAYIPARHGGLTFTRNGRGGAPVNFAANCVDSRFLPRRCARTNTRRVSPRGYTGSGTGRSTTRA